MAAPHDFYVQVDMHGLEILNHRLHFLASDPVTPTDGDIWFNSTTDEPRVAATRGSTQANRALIADDDDFRNRLNTITTVQDADMVMIWDDSATPADHQQQYRQITKANLFTGISTILNAYYRVTVDAGTTNLDASGADAVIISGDGSILQTVGSTPGTNTVEITWLTQTANLVFAGPSSGGAAAPTFRALVDLDMPTSYDPTNWDAAYSHSTVSTGNPHNVTMSDIGYTVSLTVGDPGVDTALVTEQGIREAIGSAISGGVTYKGGYDAATDTPSLDDGTPIAGILTGDMYVVTVAGDFFTDTVAIGDVLIAIQDSPTLLAHWTIVAREWDETFLALGDTPSAYAGTAGYMVMVDSTPDALEFVDPSGYGLSNFSNDLAALTQTASGGLETFSYNGSAAETLTLDFTNLTNETAVVAADEFAYYDSSATAMRALTYTALLAVLNTDLSFGGVSWGTETGLQPIVYGANAGDIDSSSQLTYNSTNHTLTLDSEELGNCIINLEYNSGARLHFQALNTGGQITANDVLYLDGLDVGHRITIGNSVANDTFLTIYDSNTADLTTLVVMLQHTTANVIAEFNEDGTILFPLLAGDEAEAYVVAIDNTTGLLSKRSVGSIAATPGAHASTHISSGGDSIAIFSTTSTVTGLVTGSNNVGATYYLDGSGAWSIPAGSDSQDLGFTVLTGEITITGGNNVTIGSFGTTNTNYGFVVGSNTVGATYFLNASGAWSVPNYIANTNYYLNGVTVNSISDVDFTMTGITDITGIDFSHPLVGAGHTVSGRTAGEFIIATAATTYGWTTMALLTTITDIADTDLFMVELAAGGLRDITWASLKTEIWEDHSIANHTDVTSSGEADNHLLVWDTSVYTNKKAKHSEVISGNDVAVDFDVVHNLGTEDIIVQIWDETSDDVVTAGITKKALATTTTVTISFATAPATGTNYKIIVYGWEG